MKTFRQIISEVAQPKSEDELNFKEKHIVTMIDHPVASEDQFTADDIDQASRDADYTDDEDKDVYEGVTLKRDLPGQEDNDVDNDGDSDAQDTRLKANRKMQIKHKIIDEDAKTISDKDHNEYKAGNKKRPSLKDVIKEALKGNQHKIDANKNGDIDAHDFELLRKKKKAVSESNNEGRQLVDKLKSTGKHEEAGKMAHKYGLGRSYGPHFGMRSSRYSAETDYHRGYDMAHAASKKKNESVEQIDELKKSTLSSYVKKASNHVGMLGMKIGKKEADADEVDRMTNRHMPDKYNVRDNMKKALGADHETINKTRRKAGNRLQGIDRASDRLAKESVEQINELSPNTLHSYIKKAVPDVASRTISAVASNQSAETKKHASKLGKRIRGVTSASGRLADKANSSMHEDADQIDELNKSTLASYVKKANDDTYLAGKFSKLDPHAKRIGANRKAGVKKAVDRLVKEDIEQIDEISLDKLKGYHSAAKKSAADAADAVKSKQPGAVKKFLKRKSGMDLAVRKAGKKVMGEEAEQIDELNKSTLASYIKKASQRVAHKSNHAGEIEGRGDQNITPAARSTLKKLNRKTVNSLKGISRATNRIVKEEAEQIDEADAVVTHKWYSVKHWKDGSHHFDHLDDHLGDHEYKHAALGNTARNRPDHHIGIPVKAKSAIAYMDKHAKSVNESVEQIDEISKSKLGDYVKAATRDVARSAANSARDYTASNLKKDHTAKALKSWRREKSIDKAVDRLTKESVEQIDEISKATVQSYTDKAVRRIRGNLYKADAGYPLTAKDNKSDQKRSKGLDHADAKLGGYAKVNARESVEQIDEISKDTVKNYARKSFSQANTLVKQSLSDQPKSVQKASTAAFKRRQFGIKAAGRRLSPDEIKKIHSDVVHEQIDEAFKTGSLKLNDGSSVSLKNEDVQVLNSLFNQLSGANRDKMESIAMSGKKGFSDILKFAKEAQ